MECINQLKLPHIIKFADITTVGKRASSYKFVLKGMCVDKRIMFSTYIRVFINQKGNIKFTRMSLSCVPNRS